MNFVKAIERINKNKLGDITVTDVEIGIDVINKIEKPIFSCCFQFGGQEVRYSRQLTRKFESIDKLIIDGIEACKDRFGSTKR